MSNFAYLTDADNMVLRAGVQVTCSSSNEYPYYNLYTLPISKPWRPSTTWGTGWFIIDFGYPVSIDLIALINHNLSSDATITVTYGTTSTCGSTLAGGITWRARDAFDLAGSPTSARFWKVSIADPGNAFGYVSIGYLMMGDSTTFGTNYTYGWQRTDEYRNAELESDYGAPHIKALFDRRRFTLPFMNIATANTILLRALIDSVKRSATPVFFIPDAATNDGYFGRFSLNTTTTYGSPSYEDITLEFVEESHGESIDDGQPLIFHSGEAVATYDGIFDRDSVAMYQVETEGIYSAAIDVCRINNQPTRYTTTFLLEGTRTNSFTYSEQLDHANWVKTRTSCAAAAINATQAPDGATTADKLVEDDADNSHYFYQVLPALTNDTDQAVSVFAKAAERSIIWISTTDKNNDTLITYFNLATGAIGTQTHTTACITALGSSWYRCEIVFDSDAGGTTPIVAFGMATADNDQDYDGDTTSGCYFWGMQLEVDKPFASSYIQTTTAAATRNSDVLYFPITQHPQAFTFYERFIQGGIITPAFNTFPIYIGNAGFTGERAALYSTPGFYAMIHYTAAANVTSIAAATPVIGDTVELRGLLYQDGSVRLYQTINGAAEVAAAQSAALALASAWSGYRIYINSVDGGSPGFNAYQAVKVLCGNQNLNTCRAAKYGSVMQRLSA